MSSDGTANEFFDIESIARDLITTEIPVSDDSRSISIRVMIERTSDVDIIAQELDLLARDKNANTGIGVRPQTILGNIDVINRLNEISVYNLLAFHTDGWGAQGLIDAITEIVENPLFGLTSSHTKTMLLCFRSAVNPETLEAATDKLSWDACDFIQYHINESGEPLESACTVILGL